MLTYFFKKKTKTKKVYLFHFQLPIQTTIFIWSSLPGATAIITRYITQQDFYFLGCPSSLFCHFTSPTFQANSLFPSSVFQQWRSQPHSSPFLWLPSFGIPRCRRPCLSAPVLRPFLPGDSSSCHLLPLPTVWKLAPFSIQLLWGRIFRSTMANGFRRRVLTLGEEQVFCYILRRFEDLMALVILEMRRLDLSTGFMMRDSPFGRFDSYHLSLDCIGSGKVLMFYFPLL